MSLKTSRMSECASMTRTLVGERRSSFSPCIILSLEQLRCRGVRLFQREPLLQNSLIQWEELTHVGEARGRRDASRELRSMEFHTSSVESDTESLIYITLTLQVQAKSLFHAEPFQACPLCRRNHVRNWLYGYGEGEAAACAGRALHPDASPVQLHQTLDDGQPQPGTARIRWG